MRLAGQESWQIRIDRWSQQFDWALWLRAAERVDVPAGGVVPGPLIIEPLPEPSAEPIGADLAAEWLSWWLALCDLPEWSPSDGWPPPQAAYGPPDFAGLTGQPLLHETMTRRSQEADQWHTHRKTTGVRDFASQHRNLETPVVAAVEQALGRKAKPFVLSFQVLPVDGREIRQVRDNEFLVSEAVYDGPDWSELLRGLVEPLA
jgi:hypothetical protein